jgi:endonuclease YncB( thermonuclease family)
MRSKLLETVVGVSVTIILAWTVAGSVRAEPTGRVELVRVYDGDTFYVNVDGWPDIIGTNIGIRINGVDTPELRGTKCDRERELGYVARDYVHRHLRGADRIELRDMQRGKYFRIVADVHVDGVRVADLLIGHGLAVPYDGGTKTHDWCIPPVQPQETPHVPHSQQQR